MCRNFFKKILFFVSVFILLSILAGYAKDKDDKVKKDKDDKDKDKIEKIKDKEDKDILDEIIYTDIIKSEIIYSEKIKAANNNKNNNNTIEEMENINSIFENLEELLCETDEIKKGIKVTTPGDGIVSIKEKYIITKNKMDLINKESEETLSKLIKSDKELIVQQNDVIKKSNKKLNKLMASIESDFDKNNKNEDIFNKIKMMEKEMQTIYRQYRAIEWILNSK